MTPKEFNAVKVGDTVWVDGGGNTKPFEALAATHDPRCSETIDVTRKSDRSMWCIEARHMFATREACLDAREAKLFAVVLKTHATWHKACERLAKFKRWRKT